ncbi:MAG TPA: hypothetical protein PLO87_07840, partial [Ornithinibacter sp.]|nr:hypothetical protein [Ornithinibacter sp.]
MPGGRSAGEHALGPCSSDRPVPAAPAAGRVWRCRFGGWSPGCEDDRVSAIDTLWEFLAVAIGIIVVFGGIAVGL